jgi:hypothetical protein
MGSFGSGDDLLFELKEEGEEFGLLLCRAWIDGLPERINFASCSSKLASPRLVP